MQVTPACDLVLMGREPRRLVVVNRQSTGFDEVCAGVGEGGEVLGARVFGDCDHVMKELMKLLLSDVEREKWEKGRGKRMLKYNITRTCNI